MNQPGTTIPTITDKLLAIKEGQTAFMEKRKPVFKGR